MLAVQQPQPPTSIPDPRSVPENAPEHCPVGLPNMLSYHQYSVLTLNREPNRSWQASLRPVKAVPTRMYALRENLKALTPHYRLCVNA